MHPGSTKLGIILATILGGFILSWAFHYQLSVIADRPYPESTFLFRPEAQFSDFTDMFRNMHAMFGSAHAERPLIPGQASAFFMLLSWLLYLCFFPQGIMTAFTLYALGFIATLIMSAKRTIAHASPNCIWGKALGITLFSYPVLFCLDRGNLEGLIFIGLTAFIWAYRNKRSYLAAICLGSVIALKPYAVVFLPLFLAEWRWREAVATLVVAALVTAASFAILPAPFGEMANYLQRSLAAYNEIYVEQNDGLYFGSSLFTVVKLAVYFGYLVPPPAANPPSLENWISSIATGYFYLSAITFLIVAAIVALLKTELWKKVTLLVCCMNLLPFVCADYRLIHFFIPMFLFLREVDAQPSDKFFAILFALLMIPTSYVHFVFDPGFRVNPLEVSDSVIVHPMLMIVMATAIIVTILLRPQFNDTALVIGRQVRALLTPVRNS